MSFEEQILIPALHPIYRIFHVSLLENGHVVLEKTHRLSMHFCYHLFLERDMSLDQKSIPFS